MHDADAYRRRQIAFEAELLLAIKTAHPSWSRYPGRYRGRYRYVSFRTLPTPPPTRHPVRDHPPGPGRQPAGARRRRGAAPAPAHRPAAGSASPRCAAGSPWWSTHRSASAWSCAHHLDGLQRAELSMPTRRTTSPSRTPQHADEPLTAATGALPVRPPWSWPVKLIVPIVTLPPRLRRPQRRPVTGSRWTAVEQLGYDPVQPPGKDSRVGSTPRRAAARRGIRGGRTGGSMIRKIGALVSMIALVVLGGGGVSRPPQPLLYRGLTSIRLGRAIYQH